MLYVTIDRAAQHWTDAPGLPAEVAEDLLASAETQCRAFKDFPVLETEADPRDPTIVVAIALQAKEIRQAMTEAGGGTGDTNVSPRRIQLTPTVRSLLRPAKGKPVIG